TVQASNVTVNGETAAMISGSDATGTYSWGKVVGDSAPIRNDGVSYTIAEGSTTTPASFTNAVFPLRVALAVQDTTTLAITDDTAINGQATISLVYL
ncbi:hypothetical protein TA05_10465, partial [Citrobacter rodentium]